MKIVFREKKEYCYDTDMYLFNKNNTEELRLERRKIIKILLVIMTVSLFAIRLITYNNYTRTSVTYFFIIGLILLLGIIIIFVFLDKKGFEFEEKLIKNIYSKFGGKNHRKFVDADVKIIFNNNEIIWERASKQLNITYENIKEIKDTSKYIYILISNKSAIWIPSEVLISAEEREQIVTFINYKIHKTNRELK